MSDVRKSDFGNFLFFFLSFVSMILSFLVYIIFRVMKQNFLIRSSSVICLLISAVLFLGWPLGNLHQQSYLYCSAQALGLNYLFISTHAHFSFVMWNNLATAMGWKFLGIKDPTALVGLMFFVSISIPIVPTIIILALNLDPNSMEKAHVHKPPTFLEKYFFCVVNEPAWWGYRLWFILFSVPGIIAASILFKKTVESRRKMIKFSNTSQFSKMQLFRMFFALLAYFVLSILSVVLGFVNSKNENVMIQVSDFFPACVGFLIFITYGLGNTANEFYKKIYIKLGKKMGIDYNTSRTSVSSKSDSLSISVNRRQSSTIYNDTKPRRPSKLSEIIDEHFIYDLPSVSKEETDRKAVPKQQPGKRKNIRRGSEPSNRRTSNLNVKMKKKSIEIIPEENEDFEEQS